MSTVEFPSRVSPEEQRHRPGLALEWAEFVKDAHIVDRHEGSDATQLDKLYVAR